ncbi:MAG: hypothetical protein ACRETR_13425 [Steroidobacteraceae bacterium]
MSSRLLLPGFLLVLIPYIPSAALAQTPAAQDGPLQQLDVSAGHWVYQGQSLGEKGAHPSAWTWNEECRWSANHIFMLCSFSNTWGGKHVDSVVVDTYSRKDGAFWHYEIFNDSGAKTFASKMQIDGATRTESWTETRKGKSVRERIVYQFTSPSEVTVKFQRSQDGTHWQTTASGKGEKQAQP